MICRMTTCVLLALSGCNEPGVGGLVPPGVVLSALPLTSVSKTDVFVQVTTPRTDVLFVVDNSGSMGPEQVSLGENFPWFIPYFADSGLDYHIGVTSTDMDGTAGRNGTEGRLRQVGGYNFIDSGTPNQAQIFSGMVSMGTGGSPSERGTSAVAAALEDHRDTDNAGFYRDDATLHTVVVSDEENQIRPGEPTIGEFIGWYDGLKADTSERTFSAIVNESGRGYARVVDAIGGIVWNIDSGDWREVLVQLGLQAVGLKREYFLSERPVLGTIEVVVRQPIEGSSEYTELRFEEAVFDEEGNLLNKDVDRVWTYVPGRNSIRFLSFVPTALSRVAVTYDLLAATQRNAGTASR